MTPTASNFTYPLFYAADANGNPLAGGQLFSYAAGTSTPLATYTDATLTSPNQNPVILSEFGTAAVWLGLQNYKFALLDVNNTPQANFPIDNISGPNNFLQSIALPTGAGLVGYVSTDSYPAGTVGAELNTVSTAQVTQSELIDQTLTAFTTGGTSSAYTITTELALVGNSTNERLCVTFNQVGAAAPTLTVDSAPAAYLVSQTPSGALQTFSPPVIGFTSDVIYNGTSWVVQDPTPAYPTTSRNAHSTVVGSTTGVNAIGSWTGDFMAEDANGNQWKGEKLSLTNTLTNSGANGIDLIGTLAYSTWYYVFAIYNPATQAWRTLASISLTSPTLPAGYTAKCLISTVFTQAASAYWPLAQKQVGNQIEYKVAAATNVPTTPVIGTTASQVGGGTTSPTWATLSIANFVPPNVATIILTLGANATSSIQVAPNNQSGGLGSATNSALSAFSPASGVSALTMGQFIPESTNIYWATASTGYVYCWGYTINM